MEAIEKAINQLHVESCQSTRNEKIEKIYYTVFLGTDIQDNPRPFGILVLHNEINQNNNKILGDYSIIACPGYSKMASVCELVQNKKGDITRHAYVYRWNSDDDVWEKALFVEPQKCDKTFYPK